MTVHPAAREVWIDSTLVTLTCIEFDLLMTLAEHPLLTFTRGALVEAVWGEKGVCDEHIVDVHVGQVRRKLGETVGSQRFIRTVRGVLVSDRERPVRAVRKHRLPGRTTLVLTAVLVPLIIGTVAGLVTPWPRGVVHKTGVVAVEAEYPTARATGAASDSCTGENEDRLPDGTIPDSVACTLVTAEVTSGSAAGRVVEVWAPATVREKNVPRGTSIVLVRYLATESEPEIWAWFDYSRAVPLGALTLAFGAVVTFVGVLNDVTVTQA